MSMKSAMPGVLQRLSSRNFKGSLREVVQDSSTPLRALTLQATPHVRTPFTERLQVGPELCELAAAGFNHAF